MIPHTHTNDLDLLVTEVETLFVLTESGRIQRENDPDRSPGPRLYLAGCESGNVVRVRHDVPDETAREIEALVADEPPLHGPDSRPLHFNDYFRFLSREVPVEPWNPGLAYTFPDHFKYEHDVTLVSSDTPEGDRLLAQLIDKGVPQILVELGFEVAADIWAPWCIALHEGEIASVGMTARLGRTGAEAGVITVPALRRRGFAAAVTAGWAALPSLRGRALFYSTERSNVASQRVAERLGLRFIGASLRIT